MLSKHQVGFKENSSTQDAMVALTTNVIDIINSSKICLCIFFDLSKAFDTISHRLLLGTLSDIEIRGNVYNFLNPI